MQTPQPPTRNAESETALATWRGLARARTASRGARPLGGPPFRGREGVAPSQHLRSIYNTWSRAREDAGAPAGGSGSPESGGGPRKPWFKRFRPLKINFVCDTTPTFRSRFRIRGWRCKNRRATIILEGSKKIMEGQVSGIRGPGPGTICNGNS